MPLAPVIYEPDVTLEQVNADHRARTAARVLAEQRARLAADASQEILAIMPPMSTSPGQLQFFYPQGKWRDALTPIVYNVNRTPDDVSLRRYGVIGVGTYSDYTARVMHTGRVVEDFARSGPPPEAGSEFIGSRRRDGSEYGAPWETSAEGVSIRFSAEGRLPDAVREWAKGLSPSDTPNTRVLVADGFGVTTIPTTGHGGSETVTYLNPDGAQQTVTGDGQVISSSAPRGYFDIHVAPQPTGYDGTIESAGMQAPVIYEAPHVSNIPDQYTSTSASPGTTSGTALDSQVGTVVTTAPVSMLDGTPLATSGVPTWLVAAGVVAAIYLVMR